MQFICVYISFKCIWNIRGVAQVQHSLIHVTEAFIHGNRFNTVGQGIVADEITQRHQIPRKCGVAQICPVLGVNIELGLYIFILHELRNVGEVRSFGLFDVADNELCSLVQIPPVAHKLVLVYGDDTKEKNRQNRYDLGNEGEQ